MSNGAWGSTRPQHELDEDVEPFTVAHLSAGQDGVVPSISGGAGPQPAAHTSLAFTGKQAIWPGCSSSVAQVWLLQ